MNRLILTDFVKEKYTPIVTEFIDKVESLNPEISTELLEIDFSDTELVPYTLWKILENLGYKMYDQSKNGWEMDFVLTFKKEACKPILIRGCGITFELKLCECE